MAAGVLPACSGATEAPDDTIKIGLLLPFTGNASATAANLERAAIYAVDRINAGGGVKGRQLKVVARDTHSEVGRSRAAGDRSPSRLRRRPPRQPLFGLPPGGGLRADGPDGTE